MDGIRNPQSGQVSRALMIIAAVVLAAIIAVYFLSQLAFRSSNPQTSPSPSGPAPPPTPVYSATAGDVTFTLLSSQDLGQNIPGNQYQQGITTTERFIKVTVGAVNAGKTNTTQSAWSVGDIVDSDGRMFKPDGNAYYLLPRPDRCGEILSPAFAPVPCIQLYDVARVSKGLRIQVFDTPEGGKQQFALLDLKVQ